MQKSHEIPRFERHLCGNGGSSHREKIGIFRLVSAGLEAQESLPMVSGMSPEPPDRQNQLSVSHVQPTLNQALKWWW